MRVLVLAEYYPRAGDPTLGIWAHRQTLAARDAGADVRVLVLHRPLPPLASLRRLDVGAIRAALAPEPPVAQLDGVPVQYLRYLSPPRPWSYASWGAWAAPVLRRALARVRNEFAFDLVHAHYAVPAGDAVRRAAPGARLLVSVHGGDVHGPHAQAPTIRSTLEHAALVLANSAGTARRCTERGARATRVIHLGADLSTPGVPPATPTLLSVGNLIARKRHADVLQALGILRDRRPSLRYEIVGDGPERERLAALAGALGVQDRVRLHGRLPPDEAAAAARHASLFVLPSVSEAFGVAYIEAMAAGIPVIGSRGEDGPEEIAAAGGGIELVEPGRPQELAEVIDRLLGDPVHLQALGAAARETVVSEFTWERCGAETVRAYRDVLGR